jgi:maleate cis-trans isomerase
VSVAYAPRGLFGVLTPQANTTVEPELAVMVPAGFAWINGRLTSRKGTIPARLVDYYDTLAPALAQFANAPVRAVAVACTGASYLVGAARERELVAAWTAAAGVPVITAANAVVECLALLGARRVGLVSPYTADLDAVSRPYWESRGLAVTAFASAFRQGDDFHPIYSLDHAAAGAALTRIDPADVDAVVMLGTGMPTLGAILARGRIGDAPVLSCMLAMTFVTLASAEGCRPTREGLLAFISGEGWGGRNRL